VTSGVDIHNGSVYLPAETVDRHFRGVDCVILLIRDGALLIIPVRQAASGGCLLKIRNAAGDRVASAPDLFEANGLLDWRRTNLPVVWSDADQGLLASISAN